MRAAVLSLFLLVGTGVHAADGDGALKARVQELEQAVSDLVATNRALERELIQLRTTTGRAGQPDYAKSRYGDHANPAALPGAAPCDCARAKSH